jgi:biopolymer transport protein ExbD
MKLNRKRKKMGDIPTSSTSDIAFLLLVFFLATTKFDIKKGLGLVLPPSTTQSQGKVKVKYLTKVMIKVDKSIRLVVKIDKNKTEEDITMDQLKAKVREVIKNNPKMVISLQIERNAPYDYMVEALDRIQAAGAKKISLSTN